MGCGACFQVCPSRAIEMQDLRDKRSLSVRWDLCIFCGQCQANCPTEKGIMLSPDFDLSTTGKKEELKQTIEKKLVRCDCCSEVIAPYEQILWVAKKLGPLTFSNASLMLFYLAHHSLAAKEGSCPKEEKEFLRFERIKVLCPRCRRAAVLKS
jgi:ferredoxin